MNKECWLLNVFKEIGLVLLLGASLTACGKSSWKEEVLLHDGSKIIVERSVERGGRHEIGQEPPIKEQSFTFTMPKTNESITWKTGFSKDIGIADFQPLVLDVSQGTAYVVTHPVGCLSYNKWGRPNPPYIVFKYEDKSWKRITLRLLPADIKTPNMIISAPDIEVEKLGIILSMANVTIAMIQKANSDLTQPYFQKILRDEIVDAGGSRCGEMVYDGKGGWVGIDWFRDKPSVVACLSYCMQEKISAQYCPCNKLFKGKK